MCSGSVYFPPVIFATGWLNVRILCVYHKSEQETYFLISYLQKKSLNQLYSFFESFVTQTLNPCVATEAVFELRSSCLHPQADHSNQLLKKKI